jgi:hypothetical protein
MTKKEEQALHIFERKIFTRIHGAKYEDGKWKSRKNRELEELSKGENIVKWIKGQRINWLVHLERMEEDRMPKKDLHSRTGRDELKRKTQESMERRGKRSSSAGSEKMERVGDTTGKNGEVLFDRPKPTAGCSANGRRRGMYKITYPSY